MSLSDLLKKRLVEKFKADPDQVANEMAIANSNIRSARNMLKIEEWEWVHNAAYNAMLQAARALMFAKGYRPRSQEHHVAVVSFAQAVYSSKFGNDLVKAFDNARKKRNESLYDRADSISQEQAEKLVARAEAFVSKAAELVQ